jgi:diguanylate cyclase (GGDEF)-like protein/PAS domain S-box-containing protein
MKHKNKSKSQMLSELSELQKHLQRLGPIKDKYKKTNESLRLFKKALETMQLGVTVTDLEGNILYTNPAEADMHGYTVKGLIGKNIRIFAPSKLWNPIAKEKLGTINRWKRESINRRKDNSIFSVRLMSDVVKNTKGHPIGVVTTCEDITYHKKSEEKIVHLAYHDTLTKLPNRYLLKDRLTQAIETAKKYNRKMAILFLDLDQFKRINDTLGHDTGDKLLQQVAKRLSKYVRKSDTLARVKETDIRNTVARLGGDEFTILLTEIKHIRDTAIVAQRIMELFSKSFKVQGHEIFVSFSIGIAVFPYNGENAISLLKNADTAMYHAKKNGRNNFQFYTESMNVTTVERFSIENQLRRALDNGELLLYYQPQLDIKKRKIVGAEALLRWNHPDKGLLSAASFIPLAEETGFILPIGEWVLQTACQQNKSWQKAGHKEMRVTVNISGLQFKQKSFMKTVLQALNSAHLDPHCLELELTESILMDTTDQAIAILTELKSIGVQISIDDFGTGFSSLNYLNRFPIDILKIDKSFIRNISFDSDDNAIITAIISMAHNLNLKVIAEGIETIQQLLFMYQKGNTLMQGDLLSPPLPADSLMQLFKKEDTAFGYLWKTL